MRHIYIYICSYRYTLLFKLVMMYPRMRLTYVDHDYDDSTDGHDNNNDIYGHNTGNS